MNSHKRKKKSFQILLFLSNQKDSVLDVLIPHVANKEVADIEDAGKATIELRTDYKEGAEFESSDEENEDTLK